jgi:hypothetical protein
MIIQNALKILTKPPFYLVSEYRHHFNTYVFDNETKISVDGGLEYTRRCGDFKGEGKDWIEWTLEDGASMKELREKLIWKTLGLTGVEKPHYVLLCECSAPHLKAILKTQPQIVGTVYEKTIKSILKNRKHKHIYTRIKK